MIPTPPPTPRSTRRALPGLGLVATLLVLFALSFTLAGPSRAAAPLTDGALDPTFDGDGRVTGDMSKANQNDSAYGVAHYPNPWQQDYILSAGPAFYPTFEHDFALVRQQQSNGSFYSPHVHDFGDEGGEDVTRALQIRAGIIGYDSRYWALWADEQVS